MNSEDKNRVFIAIDIDEEVQQRLADIQGKLQKCDADVRWVVPENIHLTLRFLGYVSHLKCIFKATEDSVCDIEPFKLFLSKIGVFPDLKRPRVIWAGIKESKILSVISQNLSGLLKQCGFPEDKRDYHPHLTLGRVRSSKNKEGLVRAIEINENWDGGLLMAKKIKVMKSILKSEGAQHSSLHIVEIGKKGANKR
ncbi:RNA 2',3'-cyclic phosphodiesterase [candidate division NPL-UPA2 bacterium Unc8]|uniref:RNA 2',3'-cyclic phosphodiesterase n=2 Tax=Bacteria TaxID=2 RepID=A0A9E2BG93_PSYF1|nr:RNA 2',3'-cyclic phosphodiesterase [Bacillota bacterium]MBT9144947.1 RNA 2',3'-cyclic phosphodiesterase [Candidatus Psychracetigena formicireducens]RIH99916.1 MAG: RNA 2',3'-cyclic phosphodiesterase [candidate division NPL-UPA2 bacterium Unc8]